MGRLRSRSVAVARATGNASSAVGACPRLSRAKPLFIGLFVNETLGCELRIQIQLGKSFAKYERILSYFRRALAAGLARGELRGGTAEELTLKFAGIFNGALARARG